MSHRAASVNIITSNIQFEWRRCTASDVRSIHADYISCPLHKRCLPDCSTNNNNNNCKIIIIITDIIKIIEIMIIMSATTA